MSIPAETQRRLAEIGAAIVHEAVGHGSACDVGIKPIWTPVSICAPAFTVQGWPGDNLAIHQALADVEAGQMLVVDVAGHIGGYWGEILTAAAQARGVAGLVIDGGVRDTASIRDRQFPVFARGVGLTGTGKYHRAQLRGPVVVGGVQVHTGDLIVGDDDGVAVVPAESVEQTLDRAEARTEKERDYLAALERGVTTVELLGLASYER